MLNNKDLIIYTDYLLSFLDIFKNVYSVFQEWKLIIP